jgi:protein required for attachment to host cells
MIWVINSNSNLCRIYLYDKQKPTLQLVKEIHHPENKLKNTDLASDRPGHYQSSGAHGSYAQATNPKEVMIDRFYREIAKELEHARTQNSFDKLIMITAPSTNGALMQHLDKQVKSMVTHNLHKDLVNLTEQALLEYLRENTKYPGQ